MGRTPHQLHYIIVLNQWEMLHILHETKETVCGAVERRRRARTREEACAPRKHAKRIFLDRTHHANVYKHKRSAAFSLNDAHTRFGAASSGFVFTHRRRRRRRYGAFYEYNIFSVILQCPAHIFTQALGVATKKIIYRIWTRDGWVEFGFVSYLTWTHY